MSEKCVSSLAKPVKTFRETRDRSKKLHGLLVHSTGLGVLRRALSKWRGFSSPTDVAVEIYSENEFPHYVIGYDGEIIQIAEENTRAWHAGLHIREVRGYQLSGWRRNVGRTAHACWKSAFPGDASPLGLFPGNDPNECYVGIELIPTEDRTFTDEQYRALAALAKDVWERHDLPKFQEWQGAPWMDHWDKMRRAGRLVGHEDVQVYRRWDRNGGWDPGALRREPRFLWSKLFELIGEVS